LNRRIEEEEEEEEGGGGGGLRRYYSFEDLVGGEGEEEADRRKGR